VAESTYLATGTVLQDRYVIAGEIGRGGYSVVYRARDRRIGAAVAIKLLVPPPAAARLARERLRREVQAVRRLSHPNIVTVFDVADDGPWSFVVMEYVDGPDLAVRVRDQGPLDPDAVGRIGRDVAAALDAAHRCGMLHRDVKPQNILLAPDGRARLTDFGSARLSGQPTLTQTGGLVGTLDYAAPEVLAGARGDARAEGYALGLTLYFALTGVLPPRSAPRAGPAALTGGHHACARRAEVPAGIDAAVARATAADPDDRFPSLALFAAALAPDAEVDIALPPPKFTCVVCRASDPFGLGVCPRCARRAGGADDVLVFVERTTPGSARRSILEALEDRMPAASRADHQAAAGGQRPLLRVPAAAGRRVVELLREQGIPARTESLAALWRTDVPVPILALASVVSLGGLAAGLIAATPVLFATTPLVATGLVSAAAVGRRRPVWNPPPAGRSALPAEAERESVRALAELPSGAARGLLTDLVRRASAAPAGVSVGPLVLAACAAARELAALERHLDALEAQSDRMTTTAGGLDALARCEQGRDVLVQRLLEATATLSWLAGDAALRAGAPEATLAAAARDLESEGRAQAEAAREVEALLRPSC
jgi:predicted Ser/Thr protein kinase